MKNAAFVLAIMLFLCLPLMEVEGQFLNWLWGNTEENSDTSLGAARIAGEVPAVKVPFEVSAEDEKFLQEAQKYTNIKLSELDSCQHKVVMQIRTSCSSMTEEELAKMSVNLLNCQSMVEGRRVYLCTKSMALKECTRDMDSDVWNSYHLMNNRARAVCYAARQQQFRALTEMTVNKLVNTAQDQLDTMKSLYDGQEKLEKLTNNTMSSVSDGHKELLVQQERLRMTQQNIHEFISFNLKELNREKSLIAAGHKELSQLTQNIKNKIDSATDQLKDQAVVQEENHKQILNDLSVIRNEAMDIFDRIDKRTQQILQHHAAAEAQYQETLQNLAQINSTVYYLLNVLNQTRTELNNHLGWIMNLMGGTGDQVDQLYNCIFHLSYLLVGMIAAAFVQAPTLIRIMLLTVVPLNLAAFLHKGNDVALDFPSLTLLLVVGSVVHWIVTSVHKMWASKTQPALYLHNGSTSQYMNGHVNSPSDSDKSTLGFHDSFSAPRNRRSSTPIKFVNKAASHLKNFGCSINPKRWLSSLSEEFVGKDSSDKSGLNDSHHSSVKEKLDDSSDSDISVGECDKESTASRQSFLRSPDAARSRFPSRNSGNFTSPLNRTPTNSRSGTPVRSGTPKPICTAVCRNGLSCRNSAMIGRDVCYRHSMENSFRS